MLEVHKKQVKQVKLDINWLRRKEIQTIICQYN